jgi:acyl-coenzyme A thioesterase 9
VAAVRRVAMSRSEQRAVDVMQPAHRNMNGFMFGGYLMRRALEVAWLSAYRFARQPPTFVGLDDVVFRKPVEVGRLVEYIGRVVYAGEDGSLRVIVKAHRLSLRTGRTDPTNQFHFIFRPSS